LSSDKIGRFDGARSDQCADDISRYSDIGSATIVNKVESDSAIYFDRHFESATNGIQRD
jgi:hypothetical protein